MVTDPTLTDALSTPCGRCGGMPEGMSGVSPVYANHILYCRTCGTPTEAHENVTGAARQWVEMNKEVEDGKA